MLHDAFAELQAIYTSAKPDEEKLAELEDGPDSQGENSSGNCDVGGGFQMSGDQAQGYAELSYCRWQFGVN